MRALSEALHHSGARKSVCAPRVSGPLPPVTVHVFSDISCPWCHIGARRLQRAVRQYKRRYGQAAPIKLQWNPLLVNNDISPSGEDVDSYAGRRWGGAAQMKSRLVRAGLPEGATFQDWKTMPNSLLAHELLALASDIGIGEQANDLLFTRTYEQGGNVSLLDELLDVGQSLGMNRGSLERELTRTDRGSVRASVLERDAAAKQRLRIQAVPHFIVTGGPASRSKYSLSGSQQTSDLLGAMERVAAEVARGGGGVYGPAATAAATSYGVAVAGSGVAVAAAVLGRNGGGSGLVTAPAFAT